MRAVTGRTRDEAAAVGPPASPNTFHAATLFSGTQVLHFENCDRHRCRTRHTGESALKVFIEKMKPFTEISSLTVRKRFSYPASR
jgi:hypothetical protein